MVSSTQPQLTTPAKQPIQEVPPTSWHRHRPHNADQLLSDFRTKHLPQLLDAANLSPAQRAEAEQWVDDACLTRYLGARDFHLPQAVKMLGETLKWRVEYGLAPAAEGSSSESGEPADDKAPVAGVVGPRFGRTQLSDVELEAVDGNNYVNGFDVYGRPIVYLKKRSKPKDYEKNVRLLVFTLEHAISLMPPWVEQVVLVFDMSLYSRANSPPLHISRETLHILTSHYPERLGMAFIVNAPAVFSLLWNVVYPFLNHVTRQKIKFVTASKQHTSAATAAATPEHVGAGGKLDAGAAGDKHDAQHDGKHGGKHGAQHNALLDVIDRGVLEAAYGGGFDFAYDHAAYWAAAAAQPAAE